MACAMVQACTHVLGIAHVQEGDVEAGHGAARATAAAQEKNINLR